jgi:hypothetical protein
MSDFINVLIVIDAETIIERYGKNSDPDRPTLIPDSSNLIYMTARQDHIIGSPGSELTVKASPDDIIRWRETTLSLNSRYTSILYRFDASSGADLIDPPEAKSVVVNEPLPNSHHPLNPTTQKVNSFYWQCTVLEPGSVTYHFSFMILDHSGEKLGYYYWDPFISIQD